jgi:hypothetical protein
MPLVSALDMLQAQASSGARAPNNQAEEADVVTGDVSQPREEYHEGYCKHNNPYEDLLRISGVHKLLIVCLSVFQTTTSKLPSDSRGGHLPKQQYGL